MSGIVIGWLVAGNADEHYKRLDKGIGDLPESIDVTDEGLEILSEEYNTGVDVGRK